MHKSFSAREIEQFKSQAKRQARIDGISHMQALNAIARTHGYKDWSLLIKHASLGATGAVPFLFTRGDEEMSQAMRLVREPSRHRRGYQTRGEYARSLVEDIQARFVSASNAVDFAIAYMESALRVRRYSVPIACVANHEMRLWLPYSALGMGTGDSGPQILVNRQYKPVGDTSGQHAIYEAHVHLHLNLPPQDLSVFSHRPDAKGFLYNDGCLPWRSRTHAQAYLTRLRLLRSLVTPRKAS